MQPGVNSNRRACLSSLKPEFESPYVKSLIADLPAFLAGILFKQRDKLTGLPFDILNERAR